MKKCSFLVMGILFALAIGCNGQSDKTFNSKDKASAPANATVASTALPLHITKEDFVKLVMDYKTNRETWIYAGKKPCLVDFYADWCGPCKMIAPVLEELASEYQGKVDIYKVNTEEQQELASAFGIQSIPSLLFIPLEGQPQMAMGALPKDTFKKAFKDVLSIEE